jgi:perosamine synthetase
MSEKLALFGGDKAVKSDSGDIFTWPIITKEDEEAVLEVLRRGGMSDTDVTKQYEKEFATWQGTEYALGFNNGTSALLAAMYGVGVGVGDEIICPSVTYWASAIQVFSLGGTVVFADIDPVSLCIDPADIERKITSRTKAIMVVHYLGHPADMDPIMSIARKHNIKVIEDFSHAHGGLYKGRKVGGIGDVGAASLMSGKSLVAGEAGMLVTNDRHIYERAIALGHYERYDGSIQSEELKAYAELPLGGYKFRMHQLSAALGRGQLQHYDERCIEIRKSMNYFWDLLEGVKGVRAHRVDEKAGYTMAGWYAAHGLYVPEELGGLSITRFCDAVTAEGVYLGPGCNQALHTHGLFKTCDVYGHGKPTRIANSETDVRRFDESLPVCEKIGTLTYSIPWFKKYNPEYIAECANAIRKVSENYKELLKDDPGNPDKLGGWHFFRRK